MGNKKIGYINEFEDGEDSDYKCGIIWASIWKGEDDNKTLVTIFFTRQISPRYNEWFKSLCDIPERGHWNIIQKGTYQHGFYFKVSITTVLDNAQKLLDSLHKWKFHTDDSINFSIELTKDIDTLYTELLAKVI